MSGSVTVRLRLFAMLREHAGWRDRVIELAEGATVDDAWQAMIGGAPALARYGEVVRFARNGRYAAGDERLEEGDELAVIPPVAGGASGRMLRLGLTAEPITDEVLAELRSTMPTTADGALVLFVGQTRETAGTPAPGEEKAAAQHRDQPVRELEYEAFDDMAIAVFEDIAAEVEDRFGVCRLAIVHRIGNVPLGEPSVVVAAAAAHRGPAFDAARYAIDELKSRSPIWKREIYADGSVWVGAPARHAAGDGGESG